MQAFKSLRQKLNLTEESACQRCKK